ncbi:MAG: hypothetical protein ACRDOJ_14195 [Nocardioidaceae bacterium]
MPGRQPTVYLHIGVAKTGTTYLQALLWHNRRSLEREGLRYPGSLPGDHFRASVDLRQTPFAGETETMVPGAWDAVARSAVSAPDRAVISHETLTRTTLDQVRRAADSLRPAETHLVVTVRDLGRQLPAVWQEQVKNRGVTRYERFLRDIAERPRTRRYRHFWQAQDILDVLERWSIAVPAERVHIITVPQPGSSPGLLWERFASVVGVNASSVDPHVQTANASLGVAEAELLRRMNRSLRERMDWATYEQEVKVGLASRLAAREDAARLMVPHEHRGWVGERAEQMIGGLRKGGYDVVGDLEDLRPVFDERPVVMPREISARQLVEIAGECVGDLVADNVAQRRTAFHAPGVNRPVGRILRRVRARVTGG